MQESGISGPIYVSIGDEEKLAAFLDKNPKINPETMFVDGYDFSAYKAVGFKSFLETDKEEAKKVKTQPPQLSFKEWMGYFGAVGKVTPIPKGMKFGEVPEGVLRLGGTFVIRGNDVVYQWSDRIPGDHPDIEEVLSLAVMVSSEKKTDVTNGLPQLQNVLSSIKSFSLW